MTSTLQAPIPVLRIYDLPAARRFYVDYLGMTVDWGDEHSDPGPVYLQVSRGPLVLHLSTHHDDGTPGSAVVVFTDDVNALHSELAEKDYPFMNPGIEPHAAGRQMQVIDPFSNRLRFYQPSGAAPAG